MQVGSEKAKKEENLRSNEKEHSETQTRLDSRSMRAKESGFQNNIIPPKEGGCNQ